MLCACRYKHEVALSGAGVVVIAGWWLVVTAVASIDFE